MAEKTTHARSRDLTFGGLLLRFVAALVLVLATYNPSGYSSWTWIRQAIAASEMGPLHFFVLVLLMIGWTIFLVASFRSLGALGLTLGALFLAALAWLLVDFGVLAANSVTALTWIVLVCLALLLTVGVAGSHIWRRLTGQLEVDED